MTAAAAQSLLEEARRAEAPQARAQALADACAQLRLGQPAIAEQAACELLELAVAHRLDTWRAQALINLADAAVRQSRYAESLQRVDEAIAAARAIGDPHREAMARNVAGTVFYYLGDYSAALDHYRAGGEIWRQRGDRAWEARSLGNQGIALNLAGEVAAAAQCHEASAALARELGDETTLANALNNLGVVRERQGDLAAAARLYEEGRQLRDKRQDRAGLSAALTNLAVIARRRRQFASAIDYLRASLVAAEAVHSPQLQAHALLHLSEVLRDGADGTAGATLTAQVEQLGLPSLPGALHEGLRLAEEVGAGTLVYQFHEQLAHWYRQQGDWPKAYAHLELHQQTQHRVYNEERDRKLRHLQLAHELRQARAEAEISRLRHEELAEANNRILESLDYAGKIQRALFPTAAQLQRALGEHALYLRPKDIVSGDFIWLQQRRGEILVAVGDCTGHGVPGALMAAVAATLLDRAATHSGASPAEILANLRHDLSAALGANLNEPTVTDGLEIALVSLRGSRLCFAGAGRPLYWCQPGQPLHVVRGHRLAIGGTTRAEAPGFTETVVELPAGACAYLATDGLADQPNAAGLRFGTKALRDLLAAHAHLPLAEQLHQWTATLAAHQGSVAARDDMALLGFRIA